MRRNCVFFHSNTPLQPRWLAPAISTSCTTQGSHQDWATSTFRYFHGCQAGLSSTWSADTGAFLGYSTAKQWLYFLEIISPTSGQPQEVKPILWHWADSQLTNKLDRGHLQISCAQLFPHFRCVGVTHSRFILRKKDVKGEKSNLTQQVLNVNGSIMINNLSMKTPKAHETLRKSHTPEDKTPVGTPATWLRF